MSDAQPVEATIERWIVTRAWEDKPARVMWAICVIGQPLVTFDTRDEAIAFASSHNMPVASIEEETP